MGLVTMGVGVAALAVGGYFGVQALSTSHDVNRTCPDTICADMATRDRSRAAVREARVSDVVLGAGLAITVVGGALWFTGGAPSAAVTGGAASVRTSVTPGGAACSLSGRF